MITTPAFAAGHLTLTKAEVQDKNGNVKMEVNVAASIEDAAAGGALFGYVALTDDFQDMLALTTHEPIDDNGDDDSGPSGVHSHIVDVIGLCSNGVDPKVSASAFSPSQDTVKVDGTEVKVTGVDSDLTGEFTGTVASFTIYLEGTDVCVEIAGALAAED